MLTDLLRILLTRSLRPLQLTNEFVEDMPGREEEGLGLYLHIPFCRKLCSFCPYQKQAYNRETGRRYADALIREIREKGRRMAHQAKAGGSGGSGGSGGEAPEVEGAAVGKIPVSSIYFGGGTPALLLDELERIMSAIREYFTIGQDIGIELHPSDVRKPVLARLRELDFSMVSIGVQSFQSRCLDVLGRDNGGEASAIAYGIGLARSMGFRAVDVDLIFGMAGQTEEELAEDFRMAVASGATQVSTYPFIDFSYADNLHKPLNRRGKRKLLQCLEHASVIAGCSRTSVWTFAKGGAPKYSSITRDLYLGFGASAATLTRQSFRVNTFSVEQYITAQEAGETAASLSMPFTERTRALYWLFWNAYTLELNEEGFRRLFGKELHGVFRWELYGARVLGLIRKHKAGYRLTDRGTYLYHLLEQRYTNHYIDKAWRISAHSAWPDSITL